MLVITVFVFGSTFSIKARYGFYRVTPATFDKDFVKGLVLRRVVGVPWDDKRSEPTKRPRRTVVPGATPVAAPGTPMPGTPAHEGNAQNHTHEGNAQNHTREGNAQNHTH